MGDEDLFAMLEADLGDIAVPEVDDVTTLDSETLLSRFHRIERDLTTMSELLIARTETGREYHSRRSAYLLELRRRRMM